MESSIGLMIKLVVCFELCLLVRLSTIILYASFLTINPWLGITFLSSCRLGSPLPCGKIPYNTLTNTQAACVCKVSIKKVLHYFVFL